MSRPLTAADRQVGVGDCIKRLYFEGVEGEVISVRPVTRERTWIRLESITFYWEIQIEPDSARLWVYLSRADGGSVTTD